MTPEGDGPENREHPRAPIACRVRLVVEDQEDFEAKFANNISVGGVFVASSGELPVGSKVSLEISLKTGAYLVRATGEVIRVEKADPESGRKMGGLAIKFLEMDPESRERIREVVERNQPTEEIRPEETEREVDIRDHHRAPVSRKLRFVADSLEDVLGAVAKNIGEGGMFAETTRPPEQGDEIEVEFALKDGERLLSAVARVSWVRTVEEGQQEGYPPGCGLEFLKISPGHREEIRKLVEDWRSQRVHVGKPPPETAKTTVDQRRFARIPLTRKIRIVADKVEDVVEAVSRDISEGGMFVTTDRPPAPGSEVQVEFSLRDGENVLVARTKVVWVRTPETMRSSESNKQAGCGLRFLELEGNDGDDIRKLVEEFDARIAKPQTQPAAEIPETEKPTKEIPVAVKPTPLGAPTSPAAPTREIPAAETPAPLAAPTREMPAVSDQQAARGGPIVGGVPQNVGLDIGLGVPRAAAVERTSVRVITPKTDDVDLSGVERLIGRKCRSRAVETIAEAMGLQVQPDARREVAVVIGDREAPVEELVAGSFGGARRLIGEKLGIAPTQVWVAIPGHFGPAQRRAIKTAAHRAGFDQVRLLNATTAAAVAYAFNRSREQLALVCEFSGRGFEAALVNITGNAIEVVGRVGDPLLSSDALDGTTLEQLRLELANAAGGELSKNNPALVRELHLEAMNATLELCRSGSVTLAHERFARIRGKEVPLNLTLEAGVLEAPATECALKCLQLCDTLLDECEKQIADLQGLLLLGTHTRLAAFRDAVAEHLGCQPEASIDPERSIAIGAALLADAADRVDTIMVREVCGQTIGVGMPGGAFEALIPRNSRLPWSERRMIGASRENRTTLEVHLFQGGSYEGMFHEYLSSFVLPATQARSGPLYELTVGADDEGLLEVKARDLESGDPISLGPAAPADPDEVAGRLGVR